MTEEILTRLLSGEAVSGQTLSEELGVTRAAVWKQIGQLQGRKLNVKKAATAKEIIKLHSREYGGSLRDSEVQKLADISRNTLYKYKKELREELLHQDPEFREKK